MSHESQTATKMETSTEESKPSSGISILLVGLGILAFLGLASYPLSSNIDESRKQDSAKTATVQATGSESVQEPNVSAADSALVTSSPRVSPTNESVVQTTDPTEPLGDTPKVIHPGNSAETTHEPSSTKINSLAEPTRAAMNHESAAALAINRICKLMTPEEAIPFLDELRKESDNDVVRRLIRIQLSELHSKLQNDQGQLNQLRSLILDQ